MLEAYYVPPGESEQRIDRQRTYTIAMVSFIASGFDGYTWFKGEETIVGEEGAMTDTNLFLQIFRYSAPDEQGGDGGEQKEDDETTYGIERARRAIIMDRDEADGLPVVAPTVAGRISFVEQAAL